MADYIYTMEIRLTPDQLKVVSLVQEAARAHGMNVYLTGGAIRDILTGLPIRDLDFTVQGNALKLQKDLERAGAQVEVTSEETKTLHAVLPGAVRVEISMARAESYDEPGAPPQIAPGHHQRRSAPARLHRQRHCAFAQSRFARTAAGPVQWIGGRGGETVSASCTTTPSWKTRRG